jgi:hypothetical protein
MLLWQHNFFLFRSSNRAPKWTDGPEVVTVPCYFVEVRIVEVRIVEWKVVVRQNVEFYNNAHNN